MSLNKMTLFPFQYTACEKLSLSGTPVTVQCPPHEPWTPTAPRLSPGIIRPH